MLHASAGQRRGEAPCVLHRRGRDSSGLRYRAEEVVVAIGGLGNVLRQSLRMELCLLVELRSRGAPRMNKY